MNSKSELKKGVIAVVLAGIMWGTISIFVKALTNYGLDSFQIIFLRILFAVLILGGFLYKKDPKLFHIKKGDLWIFILGGLISQTFNCCCYCMTIINCGAAVAVVLLYTSPIFVMLLSAVVFHEKITLRKVFALVITFMGCVLVAGLVGSGQVAIGLIPLLIGLGSGIGYGSYSIFAGLGVRKYHTLTVTFYIMLFSAISLIPLAHPAQIVGVACEAPSVLLWAVAIALFNSVIPYSLYTSGLRRMEAGRAAVLVTVEPLVGTLVGVFLFKEDMNPWKAVGMLCIFAAVIILAKGEK